MIARFFSFTSRNKDLQLPGVIQMISGGFQGFQRRSRCFPGSFREINAEVFKEFRNFNVLHEVSGAFQWCSRGFHGRFRGFIKFQGGPKGLRVFRGVSGM